MRPPADIPIDFKRPVASCRRILTITVNAALDLSVSVDRVIPTHKLRCRDPVRHPGGGGVNVARVIHRLGGEVSALLAVGGATGADLRRLIEAEGVPCIPFALQEPTRENLTVVEEASGQQFRFVLPGPRFGEGDWRGMLDLIASMARDCAFVVASGSLAPGVPDDFYGRCAQAVAGPGTRFVVDAAGAPLASALEAGVHIVKPSLREFEDLVGRALTGIEDCVAAASEWITRHRWEMILISLGERGALLVTPQQYLLAEALRVAAIGTVGAGDSLLAGMLCKLAADSPAEEAFRFGLAASAATLLQPGTALCDPADVERLTPSVAIRHLHAGVVPSDGPPLTPSHAMD